jgi:ABC-2 type transport system permease protein
MGEPRSIAGQASVVSERLDRLGIDPTALWAELSVALAVQLQYRAALLIWLVFFVLKPVIFLSVWSAVARSNGGRVGGYAPEELAAYFLVAMWVIHLTFIYVLEVEGRVRRGEYAQLLVRPVHPFVADLAANLAFKALTAPVLALASAVLVVGLGPRLAPPPWAVAAFVPALLLAFAVRVLNGWTVSLVAFWLTRTQAVIQGYLFVLFYMSGELAPLGLLPSWLRSVAWLTPFPWMLAFPVELLLGRLSPTEALVGLAMQSLWVAVGLWLLGRCWRAAARRHTAVGG